MSVCPEPHLSRKADNSSAKTHPQLLLKEIWLSAPAFAIPPAVPGFKQGCAEVSPTHRDMMSQYNN